MRNQSHLIVWEGAGGDGLRERTAGDLAIVSSKADHLRQATQIARDGAGVIGAAQRRVIYAVEDALDAGFNVEEDLSVIDTRTSRTAAERASRQAQAQAFAGDIRRRATQLVGLEHEVAAKISAATAALRAVSFPEPPTAPAPPIPSPRNHKPHIRAVDRHTFKQDPLSPVPGDPKDMTAAQARAAWDAVNADIARYNARCGRTFVLPSRQPMTPASPTRVLSLKDKLQSEPD
uniref:Uncharacterized protein n=1 Tax=Mycobacterium riyadhense TaxID=486698 RepID=A0A653EEU7_9MYCO|nr:hypothetical protein BIN_B_01329 [Mycobacterium riyadhense]